ncbi:MAG: acyl-CoA thioesterase [Bacteroidetes bacterium]|nr:acyl-CoA thioesterase [Bacteroidota bacterium]
MSYSKTVKDSIVEMTELVTPQDTNHHGGLSGGRLMQWMDIAAAMAAMRHGNRPVVTRSIDSISFNHSLKLGQAVVIKASVNRVFNSSIEVGVKVFSENLLTGDRKHTNSAYLTFVALDGDGHPVKCHPVIPETEEEKRRYEDALKRREARLKTK